MLSVRRQLVSKNSTNFDPDLIKNIPSTLEIDKLSPLQTFIHKNNSDREIGEIDNGKDLLSFIEVT